MISYEHHGLEEEDLRLMAKAIDG